MKVHVEAVYLVGQLHVFAYLKDLKAGDKGGKNEWRKKAKKKKKKKKKKK